MTDADVFVDPGDCDIDHLSARWLESDEASATARKNVEILKEYSTRAPAGKRRRIVLRFLVSPLEILGDDRVTGIRICRNELQEQGGALRACSTETIEEIDCGLVFRSIGYKGVPLDGLPFDESRGTIPNDRGRILGQGGEPLRGEYAVGWIKRGPTGIIGTNKRDAQETVDVLVEDLQAGALLDPADPDPASVEALLDQRKPGFVSYSGWEAIDRVEREAGEPHGRPRVKLTTFDELLDAASGEPVSN
jgi:ferredoxin/flavodoxin---NADP+ reductase